MHSSTGVLTIDLGAIQRNWLSIARGLQKASAAAVIKANAYGLGAERVGPALYAVGCREFFLATLEEAISARHYLPKEACIYVLGGVRPQAEPLCIAARLVPVLSSLPAIRRWVQACAQAGQASPCAIKLDTGMTRLGLSVPELAQLLAEPGLLEQTNAGLVLSHLACADESAHPLNQQQLSAFTASVPQLQARLPGVRLSLANSSGIFLGAAWHFDLVRPGAALYGINPTPGRSSPVEPTLHLQLPVLQLRRLDTSASIGYGASVHLPAGSLVAVVAGGYADGLHNTIGRAGVGMVAGIPVPVVGRISMDTTVFDLSALPEPPRSAEGLCVEVINTELNVDVLAERAGALGYETLTSLGGRYRRDYRLTTESHGEGGR